MAINLEDLGLTQDELRDRVIDRIAQQSLKQYFPPDPDSENENEEEGYVGDSRLARDALKLIKDRVDTLVTAYLDKHVSASLTTLLDAFCLEETNRWGEKTGKKCTFIEYVIGRADEYMREKVDRDGKPPDRYSQSAQTRMVYMINEYLHYHIEEAMKLVIKDANDALTEGIAETARIKLGEISQQLKIKVEAPS